MNARHEIDAITDADTPEPCDEREAFMEWARLQMAATTIREAIKDGNTLAMSLARGLLRETKRAPYTPPAGDGNPF
jgi:hypothetical protein